MARALVSNTGVELRDGVVSVASSPSAASAGVPLPAAWGDTSQPTAAVVLAVITTAIPTLAYSTASKRLPAVVTTTTRLMTPVFAAVAAWVVLEEVPSVWLAPGGALVIGGLLVSLRSRR